MQRQEKVLNDSFWTFRHFMVNPPPDSLRKGGGDVFYPEILRKLRGFTGGKKGKLIPDQSEQAGSEVGQEQVVVPAGEQIQNMIVVFLQMPEQMQENRVRGIAVKNMLVILVVSIHGIKNMAEKFVTQFFEQMILRLEMGIEGGSADVRPGDDLPDGDPVEILFRKKFGKRLKNGLSGFSLSSVHKTLHTIYRKCSVWNRTEKSYIVSAPESWYHITEQSIL